MSLEAAAFHFGGSSSSSSGGGDDTETDGMNSEAKKDLKEDNGDANAAYSYQPVGWHWFYLKNSDPKAVWQPFSVLDSVALEEMYFSRKLHSFINHYIYRNSSAIVKLILFYMK